MRAAKVIKRCQQCCWRHGFAVQGNAVTLFKIDGDIFRRIGRILWIDGARIDVIRRFIPWVFKHLAFGRCVQQIRVRRKRAFAPLILWHGDLMLLGPFNQARAAREVPFTPRGNDFDIGVQRVSRQLEANLVIALACRTMCNGVGAGFSRNLDQPLRNQRARNRCTQQIIAFITRIGAHHWEHKVADKFFTQIVNVNMVVRHAHQHRFRARRFKLFALTQISGEGDNFTTIFDLQPFQDDAGIEPARIGQNDFFNAVCHVTFFPKLNICGAPNSLGGVRQLPELPKT